MGRPRGAHIPYGKDPFVRKNGFVVNNPTDAGMEQVYKSWTDTFEPVEQYTRKLYQVVTGDSNVLEEHVERLSRLIVSRGEYVTLIKRKLDGDRCNCYDHTTKNLKRKYCLQCWGTRIKRGYETFVNTDREDGKIIVAAPFADASVDWEEYGRNQKEELVFWTLPWVPMANGSSTYSYDWMIRYNHDGTELGRYYIENVKPSRSVGNYITYQHFKANLAVRPTKDHTGALVTRGDIIYEIPLERLDRVEGSYPKGRDNK